MPSPFPGMDPYLEDPNLWPDLHQSLITYIRDDLQSQIRPHYRARIGERLYVVEARRNIYPDVTVIKRPAPEPVLAGAGGTAVAVAPPADAPLTLLLSDDEYREPFIEIIHSAGSQVVTVIEVLSPANKTPGSGREMYLQKQREALNSAAHLVEINLLSQGAHTIALPESYLDRLPPHRYLVSVCRAPGHAHFELYPVALSQRLPRFRIPLKAPDADVVLDLPAIFTRCYDNGGYTDFVDYRQPSPVPLSAEEQAWVQETVEGSNIKR